MSVVFCHPFLTFLNQGIGNGGDNTLERNTFVEHQGQPKNIILQIG